MRRRIIHTLTALAVPLTLLAAQPPGGHDNPRLYLPDEIKWQEGPPSIPPGAKMALLDGDPAKEGPFVARFKLPPGYKVAPHIHPQPERLTVISGTLHFGMGDKFNVKLDRPMPAGSFGTWPAGMKHFAWTESETVIQIHGSGPWKIEYVNPADDPRNKKN